MALKIRLARGGSKQRPFYRIVVAEADAPRDGRFVERVGTYNPMLVKTNPTRIVLDAERIQHWLSVGAQPTDRVARFLGEAKITAVPAQKNNPQKALPKKKAQERLKQEADRLQNIEDEKVKAAAAAAAPAPEVSAPVEEVAPESAPVETSEVAAPVEEAAPEATASTPEEAPAEAPEAAAPVEEAAPEAAASTPEEAPAETSEVAAPAEETAPDA